jgi:kynurenine formamidase
MILDLTREISTDTKVFPGSPLPKFITWTKMDVHNYYSEVIFMSTHTGTHMDAPSHFVNDVSSIDKISVNRFISNALLIKIEKDSDELITASEIKASKVKILEGDTCFFYFVGERTRQGLFFQSQSWSFRRCCEISYL